MGCYGLCTAARPPRGGGPPRVKPGLRELGGNRAVPVERGDTARSECLGEELYAGHLAGGVLPVAALCDPAPDLSRARGPKQRDRPAGQHLDRDPGHRGPAGGHLHRQSLVTPTTSACWQRPRTAPPAVCRPRPSDTATTSRAAWSHGHAHPAVRRHGQLQPADRSSRPPSAPRPSSCAPPRPTTRPRGDWPPTGSPQTNTANPISDTTYGYDQTGNITAVSDIPPPAQAAISSACAIDADAITSLTWNSAGTPPPAAALPGRFGTG